MLLAFEQLLAIEWDPDVLYTFDNRGLGLVAHRLEKLVGRMMRLSRMEAGARDSSTSAANSTSVTGAAVSTASAASAASAEGLRVASVVTYSKSWVKKARREWPQVQTSRPTAATDVRGAGSAIYYGCW
jgi:hypothetical protein